MLPASDLSRQSDSPRPELQPCMPAPDALQLLESCLFVGRDEDWSQFLTRYGNHVQKVFFGCQTNLDFEDFVLYFPGWLFEKNKLAALHRALKGKVDSGECVTPKQQDRFTCNYLAHVVRSAVGDWHRQHPPLPVSTLRSETEPAASSPPEVEHAEQMEQIREMLRKLSADLRAPFWLRHFRALGPLDTVDVQWIAERTSAPFASVEASILQEANGLSNPDRPLSSQFIGELLGIPPSSQGKYPAVDQRIFRARQLLSKG